MLEFIVLGQIPGTHLVINFYWTMLGLAIGLTALEIVLRRRHNQKPDFPEAI